MQSMVCCAAGCIGAAPWRHQHGTIVGFPLKWSQCSFNLLVLTLESCSKLGLVGRFGTVPP